MNEYGQNIEFLQGYLNRNINIQNIDNLINNNTYIVNLLNIIYNFMCIITSLSILQWIIKTLYFYFCYDDSYIGIFTNIITIFNPVCYYLNLLQWKLADYIIIITISILFNSTRNIFNYFDSTSEYTQQNNNENVDNDEQPPE